MQTIRLKVNNNTYKYLMWFLSKFKKEEIQIINEDKEFLSIQKYLQNELLTTEGGDTELIDIDQLNSELEATIQKHEN